MRATLTGTAAPPPPRGYGAAVTWIGLEREPANHRAAIDARVEAHFAGGLLDEAERLRGRYREDLAAFSAMGYREAFDVLAGRSTLEAAMEADTKRTWAYARRQRTWFRSERDIRWFPAGEGSVTPVREHLEATLGPRGIDVYAGQR